VWPVDLYNSPAGLLSISFSAKGTGRKQPLFASDGPKACCLHKLFPCRGQANADSNPLFQAQPPAEAHPACNVCAENGPELVSPLVL